MKTKSTLLSTLASLSIVSILGVSAPAFAGDGIYISGSINSTTQENNHSRNTGSNQPNVGAAGGASNTVVDKETGIGFVGSIGYKKHFTEDFFGSVEAFYSFEDVDTTIINNVLVNNVDLNSTYGVDARFGTNVTDKVAMYGLIGATAYDFDSSLSYTFAPPTEFVSESEWALTYGGGVEIQLNDNWSTFGEFRLSNDLDFDTPVDQGGITSINELNYSTLRSGLRFSF